jgi:hypothetical protein
MIISAVHCILGTHKNSSRLRSTSITSYTNIETDYNP